MATRRASARDIQIIEEGKSERRLKADSDYLYGLKVYFPDQFDREWTGDQTEMVRSIERRARYGGSQAIAGPRGEGKSTITKHVALLAVLHGLVDYVLIICATQPKANQILDDIKQALVNEEYSELFEDFPTCCAVARYVNTAPQKAAACTVNGKSVKIEWKANRIRLPNGGIIDTTGITGDGIRGANIGGKRPQLVILDDVDTGESADSEEQTKKRIKIIEKDVMGLAGPGQRLSMAMLCTTINKRCIAYIYTDPLRKPSWNGKRYQLLSSQPERMDLWEEYMRMRMAGMSDGTSPEGQMATKFYLDNRKKMDAGAVVSNPRRFVSALGEDGEQIEHSTIQFCFNVIADGSQDGEDGWKHFNSEYNNDPPDEDEPMSLDISAEKVRSRLNGLNRLELPDETAFVTLGVDVGTSSNCHWVETAWVLGERGIEDARASIIDYGVQEVYPEGKEKKQLDDAVFKALTELKKKHDSGVDVTYALVDAAYCQDGVYAFYKAAGKPRYQPFHGSGASGDKRAKLNDNTTNSKSKVAGNKWAMYKQNNGIWLVLGDSDYWKTFVHRRFESEEGLITIWGEDPLDHMTFSNHMVAEIEETTFVENKGLEVKWKKKNPNNHYLDALYMSCVAASIQIRRVRRSKPPTGNSERQNKGGIRHMNRRR